jgi:hypothetical protein
MVALGQAQSFVPRALSKTSVAAVSVFRCESETLCLALPAVIKKVADQSSCNLDRVPEFNALIHGAAQCRLKLPVLTRERTTVSFSREGGRRNYSDS